MSVLITCKETGGYIYQVVGGEFAGACLEKNRPEKFPFIATNNWIVLAVPWSVKHFCTPISPIFPKNYGEGENGSSKALCFLSRRNITRPCD